MPITELSINVSNVGTRSTVRNNVITHFLNELPGTGKGNNTSKYIYFVETLNNGNRIYLTRPQQHGGFDFKVHVENTIFIYPVRTKNAPRHLDIINDLTNKKTNNLNNYNLLFTLIEDIFNCRHLNQNSNTNLGFTNGGLEIDLLLGVLKWLFIEQDCAYWNYSGRFMLMNALLDI